MAEVDPDQDAALRRLRAAFGFVEVLRVVDHEAGQDQGGDDVAEEDGYSAPPMGDFPSMKWQKFRRILTRKPLEYRLDHQSGSHGKYVSDAGYPELRLAFHDQDELPGGLIKRILTKTVGLSEKQARDLL